MKSPFTRLTIIVLLGTTLLLSGCPRHIHPHRHLPHFDSTAAELQR